MKGGEISMETPKIEVKCSVENCHYNNDEVCHASSLKVDAIGDCEAESSNGTSCTTFKPGESNYR